MILRTRSSPKHTRQISTPVRTKIPSLPLPTHKNDDPMLQTRLCLNNYASNAYTNPSLNLTHDSIYEIQTLNELCNQLVQEQKQLRERLEKQEQIIETLQSNKNKSKSRILSQEPVLHKRTPSYNLKLPMSTPRVSDDNAFFTFRPSESSNNKSKFPRGVFSRRNKARPS
ncbi:hypothetical protein SteCoe_32274 [Stentor coeruleus]|uniref:Uncharacterized protein n=1 Tax=Stentor coeruleus TaxID=5963 RepID=A0A1R2AZC1_9CILI|nr:hypothetical protein SteCoe_32274 [Stentor coeruleus]